MTSHTVDTSRFTGYERLHLAVHRWWPVAELTDGVDGVVPPDLPELLGRVLTGWRPPRPVQLRWLAG